MKKMRKLRELVFIISVCLIGFVANAQEKDGLSRVNKIQGIEAYFLSEPLRPYDVVLDENSGLKATSLITGGLVNESVSEKADQFVRRIIKEGEKQNVKFDAVIYTSGKKIVAVKFKDAGTEKTIGIGRVQKINGLEVYVLSEPLKQYEVLNQKGGGVKWKSAITGGLVNNTIEEDVEKLVSRLLDDAKKDKEKLDAVVYSAGKSAIGVKFK
jgi:ribosomal protein L25 (general stress protein Ctc)